MLTFLAAPNFENPTDVGADNVYNVTVQVSDGSLTATQDIAVTVTDANEAPTALAISSTSIAENNAVDAVIGTFTTTDPDAANTFSYALVSGEGDTDNGSFTISGNQLLAGSSFNFEARSSYAIRVRVADQGGAFFDRTFTITVTNVNEVPAITSAAAVNVAENTAAVSTVTATDPDAVASLVYSIAGGDDASRFSINPTTGVLAFLAASLLRFDLALLTVLLVRGSAASLVFLDKKRPRAMLPAGAFAGLFAAGFYVAVAVVLEGRFDVVLDVKKLGELSPREIEHDNPLIRRTDEMASFLGQLYNREVGEDDLVTVIRFSQIMTGAVVPSFEGDLF